LKLVVRICEVYPVIENGVVVDFEMNKYVLQVQGRFLRTG